MRTSIFGENAITKFDSTLKQGLIFTDEQYGSAGSNIDNATIKRKQGIIPGKQISTALINTVLRQLSVVLCGIFGNTLNDLSDVLMKNTADGGRFDETDSTDLAGITACTQKLIAYFKLLNKMCATDITGTENAYNNIDTISVYHSTDAINYNPDIGNIQKMLLILKYGIPN